MTLQLIEGRGDRLDAVMAVMAEAFDPAFGEAWTAAQCGGFLILPVFWMTLALDGAEPAGFSFGRVVADEAELLLLAVRPDWRRAGVGSALLDRFAGQARSRGASRLHLEMRDGNPAGLMYARAGYEQVGRRRNYYRGAAGEQHDALTLACR